MDSRDKTKETPLVTSASPNPSAPSILIDKYEGEADVQSDHSGVTNQEEDTESEANHHHSRLLRLLSGDELLCDGGVAENNPSTSENESGNSFLPPDMPGVRLRVRSLRAKDRIPSRVFRSLQHEFDSSSEDIVQQASPPPSPHHQTVIGSNYFRYSRLYASVTPETPSSATSELDGFFTSHH